MSRRGKTPPRGWQFWRRPFWTRPALLVLYGLAAGALGLVFLASVPAAVRDALVMQQAGECHRAAVRAVADADPPMDCLERIPAILSGPWHRRGPGSEWHLLVARDGRLEFYADADVSSEGSDRLVDDAPVDALLWEGRPVAIDIPGEGRVETEEWGHRGWLLTVVAGMFAASAMPMLIEAARLKRLTTDGWWSVRGESVPPIVLTPLMSIACLLGAPSMLAFLPLTLGVPLGWAVGAALLGLGLTIFAIVKTAPTRRAVARQAVELRRKVG